MSRFVLKKRQESLYRMVWQKWNEHDTTVFVSWWVVLLKKKLTEWFGRNEHSMTLFVFVMSRFVKKTKTTKQHTTEWFGKKWWTRLRSWNVTETQAATLARRWVALWRTRLRSSNVTEMQGATLARRWASLWRTRPRSSALSSWNSWAASRCSSWGRTAPPSPGWRTHRRPPPRRGSRPWPPHLANADNLFIYLFIEG